MEIVHDSTMKKQWDQWGIALSGLCIIHCLLVVFVPLLLPALKILIHSPWIHRGFACLIIVTTPLAFMPGYRRHGLKGILWLAMAGVVLVLAGVFLDGTIDELASHGLSMLGSFSLVSAHLWNLRHSHQHTCC